MESGDAREESPVVTLEPASDDDASERERFLAGSSAPHTRRVCLNGRRVGFVVLRPIDDGQLLDDLHRFYERHGFELAEVGEWYNAYVCKPRGAK